MSGQTKQHSQQFKQDALESPAEKRTDQEANPGNLRYFPPELWRSEDCQRASEGRPTNFRAHRRYLHEGDGNPGSVDQALDRNHCGFRKVFD